MERAGGLCISRDGGRKVSIRRRTLINLDLTSGCGVDERQDGWIDGWMDERMGGGTAPVTDVLGLRGCVSKSEQRVSGEL